MPIIDILTGGGTNTNSNSNGSGSSGSTLSNIAKTLFPKASGILSSILNGLSCLGGQGITENDYNVRKTSCETFLNTLATNPYDIPQVQWQINQLRYLEDYNRFKTLPALSNACSKAWTNKMIDVTVSTKTLIMDCYNYNGATVKNINGMNVLTENVTSFKGYPNGAPPVPTTPTPTTQPPSNPTSTPTNNGGTPPTNPPPTNPTSTPTQTGGGTPTGNTNTDNGSTSTNTGTDITTAPSGGTVIKTRRNNGDGTYSLVYTDSLTGLVFKTTTIPVSTANLTGDSANLEIGGYYDSNGNWQFGAGSGTSSQTQMIMIGGAVGLGALLLILNKKK